VPTTGELGGPPGAPRRLQHRNAVGPLARAVGDLALALRVTAGPDGRHWDVPPVSLEAAAPKPLRALRLAWTDGFGGVPVSGDTRGALARLAGALEARGCRVARCAPEGFDWPAAWETYGELNEAEGAASRSPEQEARRAEQAARAGITPDAAEPLFRGMARMLQSGGALRRYAAALERRDSLIGALERFFDAWDALLCPVSAGPAIPHCPPGTPIDVDGARVPYWTGGTAHCTPFNLTGHPAVVLPLARSSSGLPLGLQVVGRRWGELPLLAVAEQLADVIGPFGRPPGF
jgi:amidase